MDRIELFDGGYLYYSKGRFDDWCVYEIDENGVKSILKDIDYFNEFQELSSFIDSDRLYNDFVKVYNITGDNIKEEDVTYIQNIVKQYDEYAERMFRLYSILYMAMIAEQNKKNTKLGKRIKRLGMYNLLVLDNDPEYCANFMKQMGWREIDKLCIEGGF